MATDCAVAKTAQAGKYLSFKLDHEEYGLEILRVQEIVSAVGIAPAPRSPEVVSGVIALRGNEIPIIQLRHLFGLECGPESEKNCIIIAQIPFEESLATVGLLVDEVCEVLYIGAEEIQFPPSRAAGGEERDFVNGLGLLEEREVVLLDIENFFSEEELKAVVFWDD